MYYDKRTDGLIEKWDNLLVESEVFALLGEGSFDQEAFREAMLETWELFSEQIDFDAEDTEYKIPIKLAVVLGQLRAYSMREQIMVRDDEESVEPSALIAGDLYESILERKLFIKDRPLVLGDHFLDEGVHRLIYDMETGELSIQKGESITYVNDKNLGEVSPKDGERIVVEDISSWWEDDLDERYY